MLIPIDRPMIDARNIRGAATQTISDNDFTLVHNNRPVLLCKCPGGPPPELYISSVTTAVEDGSVDGQELTLVLQVKEQKSMVVKDGANTNLKGDWYQPVVGAWLALIWDSSGSQWIEVGRSAGSGDASGNQAHIEGNSTTASGSNSHAQGSSTVASGNCSHAMGRDGLANQECQFAQGGSKLSSVGDVQYSRFVLRGSFTHSNANWSTIGVPPGIVGPVIPIDSVWTFEAQIVGSTIHQGKVFGYTVSGVLINTAGVVTLQPSDPIAASVLYESDTDFDCRAVADDTNDALAIQVRDSTSGGDFVKWVATVHLTQITST